MLALYLTLASSAVSVPACALLPMPGAPDLDRRAVGWLLAYGMFCGAWLWAGAVPL